MRNYGVYEMDDFSPEKIKETINSVFNGAKPEIKYAVLYYEHVKVKDTVQTEEYEYPYLKEVVEEDDYGCVDFYQTKRRAIDRYNVLPVIVNKEYHRIAVISIDGKVIAIER